MPVKMTKRISSITTERRAPPSTPETLKHFTNYQFNHTAQREVRPKSWCGRDGWTTPNKGGNSLTFGVGSCAESGSFESPNTHPGATKI